MGVLRVTGKSRDTRGFRRTCTSGIAALLVTAFFGLLLSPVSWSHHYVWVVPLIVLLLARLPGHPRLRYGIGALVLVFASCVLLIIRTSDPSRPPGVKPELEWTPPEVVLGSAYLLEALAWSGQTALAAELLQRSSNEFVAAILRGGAAAPQPVLAPDPNASASPPQQLLSPTSPGPALANGARGSVSSGSSVLQSPMRAGSQLLAPTPTTPAAHRNSIFSNGGAASPAPTPLSPSGGGGGGGGGSSAPKFIAHKFRERFGVWPVRREVDPLAPSDEVRAWVRSRQIAYAKARA